MSSIRVASGRDDDPTLNSEIILRLLRREFGEDADNLRIIVVPRQPQEERSETLSAFLARTSIEMTVKGYPPIERYDTNMTRYAYLLTLAGREYTYVCDQPTGRPFTRETLLGSLYLSVHSLYGTTTPNEFRTWSSLRVRDGMAGETLSDFLDLLRVRQGMETLLGYKKFAAFLRAEYDA